MGLGTTVLSRAGRAGAGANPLGLGLGAAGAATAAVASFNGEQSKFIVPEGYMGVRTRFKKVPRDKNDNPIPKIYPPGFRFDMIPLIFSHSLRLVDVRDRWCNLGKIPFTSDKEKEMEVEVIGEWRVSKEGIDPYKALFNIHGGDDLDTAVRGICIKSLKHAIRGVDNNNLQNEDMIYEKINERGAEKLGHYGSVLLGIYMGPPTPRGEQITSSGISDGLAKLGEKLGQAIAGQAIDTESSELVVDHGYNGSSGNGSHEMISFT